jgi:hypothetical protein
MQNIYIFAIYILLVFLTGKRFPEIYLLATMALLLLLTQRQYRDEVYPDVEKLFVGIPNVTHVYIK